MARPMTNYYKTNTSPGNRRGDKRWAQQRDKSSQKARRQRGRGR